jgi:hypothetical protein
MIKVGAWVYIADFGSGKIVRYEDYLDGHSWCVRLDDGREIDVHEEQIVDVGW